jgi:hypothetical protein
LNSLGATTTWYTRLCSSSPATAMIWARSGVVTRATTARRRLINIIILIRQRADFMEDPHELRYIKKSFKQLRKSRLR